MVHFGNLKDLNYGTNQGMNGTQGAEDFVHPHLGVPPVEEGPLPPVLPDTHGGQKGDDPCLKFNCGEGGCYLENGKPKCMCTTGQPFQPPDKDLKCPRQPVKNTLPPIPSKLAPLFPIKHPPTNDSTPQGDRNESSPMPLAGGSTGSHQIHLRTIQIVVPVVALTVVIITVVVFLLRRRRSSRRGVPKSESPITWLHRHDSFMLLDSMAVVSKNPNYYTPTLDTSLVKNLQEKVIPREKLRLCEVVGEGAFGKVYKGEVSWTEENVENVAVKVLKEGATRETRDDFKREVEIMSSFEHENILKLIGVVSNEDESPYMVFEYMEFGDLAELLRKNDPSISRESRSIDLKQAAAARPPFLAEKTDLIDIATQIANGMVYLTSQHFVHRDLATRNCLVGAELIVKISDFGMSRDIYTCDYYRIGGSRMLPVRWMSPESVKYGRFTTESDVWAFGVVLWEIFSFGKQPYYGHTNEEVIRFIEDGILLQKPEDCPSTVYHVMLGCWRSDPKDRFSFDRIHRHLVDFGRKLVKCYHQHNIDISDYDCEDI